MYQATNHSLRVVPRLGSRRGAQQLCQIRHSLEEEHVCAIDAIVPPTRDVRRYPIFLLEYVPVLLVAPVMAMAMAMAMAMVVLVRGSNANDASRVSSVIFFVVFVELIRGE